MPALLFARQTGSLMPRWVEEMLIVGQTIYRRGRITCAPPSQSPAPGPTQRCAYPCRRTLHGQPNQARPTASIVHDHACCRPLQADVRCIQSAVEFCFSGCWMHMLITKVSASLWGSQCPVIILGIPENCIPAAMPVLPGCTHRIEQDSQQHVLKPYEVSSLLKVVGF